MKADKSNYNGWRKINTKYLIDTGQSSRVFPHRVNTIGKLKDIWSHGFRSFEVDVHFRDYNKSYFQLGHHPGVMGGSLENLLSSVEHAEIQRVWLDFKNLNENNYKKAIERLKYLDDEYGIKQKFIVESSETSALFKDFKKEGWHTAYYAPTKNIVELLEKKNIQGMNELAVKIAAQSKDQNLSAISFDSRLYPFIKQYLEPLITGDIVYHTWLGPSVDKEDFPEELSGNVLYLDERIKTILVTYKSQYDL